MKKGAAHRKEIRQGAGWVLNEERIVPLNGDRQNIRIASKDVENPVLLFLHGGPGVCNRHEMLWYQTGLIEKYTLVFWDQRGSGKSWRKSVTKENLTVETYLRDAADLIDYLLQEFHKEKLVIIGHSWGTILGTPLVERYPEKVSAYVGIGQFVNLRLNEEISYNYCVREAEKAGDTKVYEKLVAGPPVDGVYPDKAAMMVQRNALSHYHGAMWKGSSSIYQSVLLPLVQHPGYDLKGIYGYARGALYLPDALWPDIMNCDYLHKVKALDVPVLLTMGRHDWNTPFELAREWYDNLEAPKKEWVWFEESAHSPVYEEPEAWQAAVLNFLGEIEEIQ